MYRSLLYDVVTPLYLSESLVQVRTEVTDLNYNAMKENKVLAVAATTFTRGSK
jgi:hypothetical protein